MVDSCVSKLAATRILGTPVKRIEEWGNCVFVVPYEGRATFVSYREFQRDSVQLRQAGARSLRHGWFVETRDNVRIYRVVSSDATQVYSVYIGVGLKVGKVACTCKDFQRNDDGTHRHHCKHILFALSNKLMPKEYVPTVWDEDAYEREEQARRETEAHFLATEIHA